ncbi:palmitoyltransferase ERF2-like [Gigantopelta aegis]|uniref:palmitoyltransferase ERF2-like n=1 Tax=Gigantopelta aegis TaxID=1735272 RepID=UPI001B88C5BA|nr:palmitoyltransferase ERF2-like [Gigantopelta aegis]
MELPVTTRVNFTSVDNSISGHYNDMQPTSLMGKLRDHYYNKGKPKTAHAKHFARCLFLFEAFTQLYTTLTHLIPYCYSEYDPWTQYYLKVLVFYMFAMAMANWLCVTLYDTSVPRTRDRPYLFASGSTDSPPEHFIPRLEKNQNGHVSSEYDSDEKDRMPWKYCEICRLWAPPRAHHCDFCKVCILKRDHHCFFVGNCIGFRNQRYFVVLSLYMVVIGLWGGYLTAAYIAGNYWAEATCWDFLLPVTITKLLLGYMDLLYALVIFQSYCLWFFGSVAVFYFLSQMSIIAQGLTLYELAKNIPIKNNSRVSQNMRSVFGDFWALNFLFPAQILFKQREDGTRWECVKLLHNNNNVKQSL